MNLCGSAHGRQGCPTRSAGCSWAVFGLENNANTDSPSTISPINPTIPVRAKSTSPPNALPAWPLPMHAAYGLHGAITAAAQMPRATLVPMMPAPATMPGGAAVVSFRSRDADVIWSSLPHWLFDASECTGPAVTRAVDVIVMVMGDLRAARADNAWAASGHVNEEADGAVQEVRTEGPSLTVIGQPLPYQPGRAERQYSHGKLTLKHYNEALQRSTTTQRVRCIRRLSD
jgi:hypothetical protein